MADKSVLVTYATRAGSTRELAEQVSAALTAARVVVDLKSVDQVSCLSGYDAVVLGSAIYFNRLMPQAISFLQQHADALAKMPVALFSVGAEMRLGTPKARAAADAWVRHSLASVPALQFIAIEHFAGAVEMRRLSFGWQLLVLLTFGERGDWRNPERIRAWATQIRPKLLGSGTIGS